MRTIASTLFALFIGFQLSIGQSLVLVNFEDNGELKQLKQDPHFNIHYLSLNFVIGMADELFKRESIELDKDPLFDEDAFYIAWFYDGFENDYQNLISGLWQVVYTGEDFLVLKSNKESVISPPTKGSLARISSEPVKYPKIKFEYMAKSVLSDPDIITMMDAVDTNLYLQNLQHLQDYGTRNAYTSQSVQAQNWLKAQLESYGYPVELFDFSMPSGPASDNVLATKIGTKYPDEYVLVGAHYDSYSYSGGAPGADDNGTGTCGVLEAARVMADYDFDRSIIFCCWSGEEYGLYGSEAYASWAQSQGMNILAYFNIDMCGYLNPGDPIHTDIIAPSSAQPLVDFYTSVCSIYLPDFIVETGSLSGGDSDHTSFNDNGYMGIFPFEDSQYYSPYIHTSNDIIGLSVNSLEMAKTFTQAAIANVASMANYIAPPANLTAIAGDENILLNWDPLVDADFYNIYRDGSLKGTSMIPEYTDEDVIQFNSYTYYVTAVITGSGEETSPSNAVNIMFLPRIQFPFSDDFETGANYWNFGGSWGLSTNSYHSSSHSMTESPSGNYANNLDIATTLYTFSLAYTSEASISFWTKYNLETNYDYMYLEISTDGTNWTVMDTYNGIQSAWTNKNYSLNGYLGEPTVTIRFRFYSDYYITKDGMYIDDFNLTKVTYLDVKAFLEGPFQDSEMSTVLNSGGYLPLEQPYNISPWNYNGDESVASIPNSQVVDWVLIEIRDANDPSDAIISNPAEQAAAFLLNDGSIVDINGSSLLMFKQQIVQQPYVLVRHRNHLDVLASNPLTQNGSTYYYDFSTGEDQAYGESVLKNLGNSNFGLIGGDGNADGTIDSDDKISVWQLWAGKKGYDQADYDLNSQINNQDKNEIWFNNTGSSNPFPN
jgi:hypothetical protein